MNLTRTYIKKNKDGYIITPVAFDETDKEEVIDIMQDKNDSCFVMTRKDMLRLINTKSKRKCQ